MKRKLFIVFMIVFTVLLSGCLFVSLICGTPTGSSEAGRYFIGALGVSIMLPASFTFFFLTALYLNGKLQRKEENETAERENNNVSELPAEDEIPALVSALAKKKNLTQEEKERLLTYLEEL